MPQTNLPTDIKVLESTIEKVKNGNIVTCIGNDTNRKKVRGKVKNI